MYICVHKGAPQRYETQKPAQQLRFIHHPDLRKGLGVWGFKGGSNSWESEKRKDLVNSLPCHARESFRRKSNLGQELSSGTGTCI